MVIRFLSIAFGIFISVRLPYTVEAHISYLHELKEGSPLQFSTQLLGYDVKRIHLFHQMFQAADGYLAATTELMVLYVDQQQGRTVPFPETALRQLEVIYAQHVDLPRPAQAGRWISM